MWNLLPNTPQPRHAHLEDQTPVVGLLGRLPDQATDGHWQQKGETRIRKADTRLLSAAQVEPTSPSHTAGAVHQVEIRAEGVRELPADAELHARPHGELFDEARQGGQQIPPTQIRAQRSRRHPPLLRQGGEEPESHFKDIRFKRRVCAPIQDRHGSEELPADHVFEFEQLHPPHIRLSRRRRDHRQLVPGDPLREAAVLPGRLSKCQ